jgi:hypothetical protein
MPLRLAAGSAADAVNLNSHEKFRALRKATGCISLASEGNAAARFMNIETPAACVYQINGPASS